MTIPEARPNLQKRHPLWDTRTRTPRSRAGVPWSRSQTVSTERLARVLRTRDTVRVSPSVRKLPKEEVREFSPSARPLNPARATGHVRPSDSSPGGFIRTRHCIEEEFNGQRG